MIIQFHTPKGIVEVNGETITDKELATFNVTREAFTELVSKSGRDLVAEIDDLKARLEKLEVK